MFTGLVQAMGTIAARLPARTGESGLELVITSAPTAAELSIGASVSVSGVCLTAVAIDGDGFRVDVAAETLRRTWLGKLSQGDFVNLELPLRPTDRLGGHFVQGHVDGVGRVTHAGPRDGDYVLRVEHSTSANLLVVEKGSIALDGVSLTVTGCGNGFLEVMLIPHTLQVTTLGRLAVGDDVHIEYDILAKYMARISEAYRAPASGPDEDPS